MDVGMAKGVHLFICIALPVTVTLTDLYLEIQLNQFPGPTIPIRNRIHLEHQLMTLQVQ